MLLLRRSRTEGGLGLSLRIVWRPEPLEHARTRIPRELILRYASRCVSNIVYPGPGIRQTWPFEIEIDKPNTRASRIVKLPTWDVVVKACGLRICERDRVGKGEVGGGLRPLLQRELVILCQYGCRADMITS
jgi:hypothetical protein